MAIAYYIMLLRIKRTSMEEKVAQCSGVSRFSSINGPAISPSNGSSQVLTDMDYTLCLCSPVCPIE